MTYNDIKTLVLAYSDREDAEVINNIDSFILLTEAILNRKLKVGGMATRSVTTTTIEKEYYTLPDNFAGLRDIEIRDSLDSISRTTLQYLSPEQLNQASGVHDGPFYTLIANQIQLVPRQDAKLMEVIYYKKVPNLSDINDSNWVSENFPDCYVYGILVELSAFVKNADASRLWNEKFKTVIQEIKDDDATSRWSGTALQTRIELN